MSDFNNKLQVSLNNLDDTTKNTLNFFFGSGLCDKAELQSKSNNTDVHIIDLDRNHDKQVLSNLKNNSQYAIIFHNQSSSPLFGENIYSITKPVKAALLKQQINTIRLQLQETKTEQTTLVKDSNQSIETLLQKTTNHALYEDAFKQAIAEIDEKQLTMELDQEITNQTFNEDEDRRLTQEIEQEIINHIQHDGKKDSFGHGQAPVEYDDTLLKPKEKQEDINHIPHTHDNEDINNQTTVTDGNKEPTENLKSETTGFSLKTRNKSSSSQKSHLSAALKGSVELDTLNQYKAHKHVGSNKDINPNNPKELEKVYLTPKKYIFHHLAKAVKLGRSKKADTHLKTLFGSFLFEYKTNLIYHDFSSTKLRFIKYSPLFLEASISLLKINTPTKNIKPNTVDAESLIWEAAIIASKGRIPRDTSLTQVVEMRTWPNYTKLLVFRYVVQITATWATHHLSLIDTSTQLNIPQRYIFTLFNAMLAIKCAKTNNVTKKSKTSFTKKRRAVFSKILSHIFRK